MYSNSLNLPQTTFPMRADAVIREPGLIRHDVYRWQLNRTSEDYILHDGPPYANGSPHIGHALNKILKDITVRYKILRGYKVNYIPGWDCHGLPIELKALERLKESKDKDISPLLVRKIAREYALTQIEIQKKEFIKWGVLGEWDDPYLTLNPKYESMQINVFLNMFKKGLIYRAYKPVYWSPSSKTALAEAELDYNDKHVSLSTYVLFRLNSYQSSLLKDIKELYACIWTTTPWTLSANNAICVSTDIVYSVVTYKDSSNSNEKKFLIAKELIPTLESKMNTKFTVIIDSIPGSELVGSTYIHPFINRESRIIDGSHVTVESGTGLVHTAPGHGQDDFIVCSKNGIEVICHVNDDGVFTSDAGERLQGKSVLADGNKEVIEILKDNESLLHFENFVHKYPYDWRTKKPVILRATMQWFADLNDIKNLSINSLENVNIIPSNGKLRLSNMIQNRNHWCISRQRSWGVPIPVFYDIETNEPLMNEDTVSYVSQLIEEHGTNCWWDMTEDELIHPKFRDNGRKYKKGYDTMDVWFDSGTSWAGTLISRNLHTPADLYLEGSDQHRGWFQSSLLTSIASHDIAPFKTVLTHGFVLDGNMQKMSKSLGNVIEPSLIIEGGKNKKEQPAYGVDILRLWVSSTDYTKDVSISPGLIETTSNNMKKIRNTLRFLLGNLYDFKSVDFVNYDQLLEIDKFILHSLTELIHNVTQSYDQFLFYKVQNQLLNFCITDLSSFYMNVTKDRLYSELNDDPKRRAVQSVFTILLETITILFAPIACHVTEDVYQNMTYRSTLRNDINSIFGEKWPEIQSEWRNDALNEKWKDIIKLKDEINYTIESLRSSNKIKNPLEVELDLFVTSKDHIGNLSTEELEELFVVSKVNVHHNSQNLHYEVKTSVMNKCNRCWKLNCEEEEEICKRCSGVVKTLEERKHHHH